MTVLFLSFNIAAMERSKQKELNQLYKMHHDAVRQEYDKAALAFAIGYFFEANSGHSSNPGCIAFNMMTAFRSYESGLFHLLKGTISLAEALHIFRTQQAKKDNLPLANK
ncbi:hypothetical protein Noda2021_05770 [Candidatus Dependentiae bacterium Noda2021]|nr:hypothetical protein Noda2021_05770 [Candidatus Dependentiae bacterium Noda2021]